MFKLMGKNSELILSRLKSWRLTDGNGTEGDNLTLTINSDDIDGIPPKGEKYTVYLGEVKRDVFEISQRSIELHPRKIQRTGRKVSINAPVNTAAFAEGIVILDESFPRAFQGKCSIDSVTISGAGLQPTRMNISATLTGE